MSVHLDNISIEEVKQFIASLNDEDKKFYDINAELICDTAFYIQGMRIQDKLVGIAGIVIVYKLLHHTFYMIKKEHQGRGLGRICAIKNKAFALNNNLPLLLMTVELKNEPAMRIANMAGFREIVINDGHKYLYMPLNKTGYVIGRFLPIIAKVYLSPLGNVPRYIRSKKYEVKIGHSSERT